MAREARKMNSLSEKSRVRNYKDGNAVSQIYKITEKKYEKRRSAKSRVSTQVMKNRMCAKNVRVEYVIFLAAVSMITLFLCVTYLKEKIAFTFQNDMFVSIEKQLIKLKSNNDAYYNQVIASITLEDVKYAAMNRFGMHYATEAQIQYYDITESNI